MQEPKFLHEAALRIRNDPQLAPFVEWLRHQREAKRDLLETADDDIVQRVQGEASSLRSVISLIEDSPRVLEKKAGR